MSEAFEIAADYLDRLGKASNQEMQLVLLANETIDALFGWVFFYNTKQFADTDDIRYAIAGNAPIIVDRSDGRITVTGTAYPIDYYIKEYRRLSGNDS